MTNKLRSGITGTGAIDVAGLFPVAIGNGLFARVRRSESLMDQYRRKQQECRHEKRDPRGTCYHCGQPKQEGA